MKIKGKVHKFGKDVNTDEIIPAPFLNTTDPKELGAHCMDGIEAGYGKKIKPGDIIVAGKNFGCGSSREHAPLAIKGAGVSCVIAESFARIFYRNCINIGLPIYEDKKLARRVKCGQVIDVELKQEFPAFMQEIIDAGGLMKWVRKRTK